MQGNHHGMAVTMSDIARLAGVSVPTVGRALNQKGYVSPEVRERVEAAAQKLGYVPNRMARALKSGRSGLIGSLVFGNENNVYQRINRHIMSAAEEKGFHVVTLQTCGDGSQAIQQLIEMRVDGLAVISHLGIAPELFGRLHQIGIPVVAVERTYDLPYVDNIEVRDREAVFHAAQQLLALGHRHIGMICPSPQDSVEEQRLEGFHQALEEAGIPREQHEVELTDSYSTVHGKLAALKLLARSCVPTALVCASDILAAGAMQALYANGLRVPEDISIVGYDNTVAAYLSPPIDSVDLDLSQVGEILLNLLERRRNAPDCPARTEYLGTTYVARGTTAQK